MHDAITVLRDCGELEEVAQALDYDPAWDDFTVPG